MSSWEEYKKKKQQNVSSSNNVVKTNVTTPTSNKANTTNVSNNTWNRVMNTASNILKDTGTFFKNLTLGAQSGGISAIGQTEFLSQQRSENYRRFQQQATEIEQKRTKQGIIDFENKKNENAKLVNGVLVRNQPKINDSAIMQRVNTKQEEINQKMAQNAENAKTKVGKYLASDVAPSMGQSLVGTGLDIIAPGMGSAYRTLSYGGNYTQDALKAGMNEKQSAMYGLTMAGVETAMDTVGDKLKGVAIGEAKKAKGFKEFIKLSAKELGINSFFEGAGEALTEPLQEAVKQAYGGKADYENILQRMGKSFLAGATSELLMTGASLGYGGSINVVNKLQNGEQVSTQEISKALKEINQKEEIDIEKVLIDKLGFTAQDLYKNTDVEQKVNDKIDNISTEISQNEIRGILPKKQLATMENKPISEQTQQVISNEGKMAENQMSKEIEENDNVSKNSLNEAQNQVKKFKKITEISNKEQSEISELTELNMQERKDYKDIKKIKVKDLMESNLQPRKKKRCGSQNFN